MRPVQLALWITAQELLDRCLAKSSVVTSQKNLYPFAAIIKNSQKIQGQIPAWQHCRG